MRSPFSLRLLASVAMLVVALAPLVVTRGPAQAASGRQPLGSGQSRVSEDLLQLVAALGPRPQVASGGAPTVGLSRRRMLFDSSGRVGVTITATRPSFLTRLLRGQGVTIAGVSDSRHMLEAFVPVSLLPALEQLTTAGLLGVSAIPAPIRLAGAVTSQADFVHEADRVRATMPPGLTGVGVRIGVMGDSFNQTAGGGGTAGGVATGDLPNDVNVYLEGPSTNATDEGRAMAELVHDLAPGAKLTFGSGLFGETAFAQTIRDLADPTKGDCDVIVDDVTYPAEPMFQDGVAAQAVDEVVTTRGVAYFSAAGNQSDQSYESSSFDPASDGATAHDFDPGAGVDTRQRVTIAPNSEVTIVLEWDDPFYTAAGVDTDLDIFLLSTSTGFALGGSIDDNIANQRPVEVFSISNPAAIPLQADLLIKLKAGPVPGRIKYVYFGSMSINQFATHSSTINPHSGSASAMSVGAIPYYTQQTPDTTTSQGPTTILFDPAGNALGSAQVRQKPDIAAIEGTDTTFFGSDVDGTGRPNFYGTSAAASHAAAIAALMLEHSPSLTPAQLYQQLKDTADASVYSPGVDARTGAGLINAYDAVFGFATPGVLPFSEDMNAGALPLTFETHTTGAGRIQVTSANAPASGIGHVVLDSSLPDFFGRNEVILHVNLAGQTSVNLSFLQKEFKEGDDAMPLTFTGSTNADGVAFSVDGVNWRRVSDLTGGNSTNTYSLHSIDLSAAASGAGITLGADTRIKFQQYGSQPAGSGGFAFDDISVTNVNEPPVVQANKAVDVVEDSVNNPLAIAAPTDPDGDPLTITVTNLPTAAKGSVHFAGGGPVATGPISSAQLTGLQYDPAPNQNGAAGTFTYSVSDGTDFVSQTVMLSITAVNDAPVATGESYNTPRATPLVVPPTGVLGNDTDVENDPLTAVLVSNVSHGTLTLNANGSFTYTPVIAFFGADTFTYRANDGTENGNTVTVTLNVSENPPTSDPNVQAEGSGTINSSGGSGTLAFNVRRTTGVITGSLVYTDPNRSRTVTSTKITSLVMGPGRAMRIFGKGKLPTGDVVDFVADVDDVAEPGKGKDTFKLEISNSQTPLGTLTAGNIRVNR